jgi:hypothetical protein
MFAYEARLFFRRSRADIHTAGTDVHMDALAAAVGRNIDMHATAGRIDISFGTRRRGLPER